MFLKAHLSTEGVKWISNIKQPVRYFQARTAAETSITRHLEKYNIALVCGENFLSSPHVHSHTHLH